MCRYDIVEMPRRHKAGMYAIVRSLISHRFNITGSIHLSTKVTILIISLCLIVAKMLILYIL